MQKQSPAVRPMPFRLALGGMCLYTLWLMLPAVQVLGKAVTGVAAVALFALGVLLDRPFAQRNWRWLALAALAALGLPMALYFGLGRGDHSGTMGLLSYWCQQGMFWFPLIVCAYLRRRGEPRYARVLIPLALACVALTALTTTAWLCEGYTHSPALAYSRSLGYADSSQELHRKLMLRGVGGYDFVYGCLLCVPLALYFSCKRRGRERALALAFLALLTVTVALSQFLYAMIFLAAIYAVWAWGLLIRWLTRRICGRELALDWAMLTALAPAGLIVLLRVPLSALLVQLSDWTDMNSVRYGARLLYEALTGQGDELIAALPSRLDSYSVSVRAFAGSPWLGLLTGEGALGKHSDALDLLAGLGLIGAGGFLALASVPGRGLLRGLRKSPARPYVALCLVFAGALTLINTVFYSRELSLMVSVGLLAALGGEGDALPAAGDPTETRAGDEPAPTEPLPRAAVFDLDGTLLDTLDDLADSVNAVLAERGYPARGRDEVRAFVGNGIRELMRRALPDGADDEAVDGAYQAMLTYYQAHCAIRTAPYRGVPEALEALRAAGWKIAVVSNKADAAVEALCERYLPGLVDVARGDRPGQPRKPAPEPIWAALDALGCERAGAAYIGDSDVDVLAARAAGMDGVFVTWGFRSRQTLLDAGASRVVDAPAELLDALLPCNVISRTPSAGVS